MLPAMALRRLSNSLTPGDVRLLVASAVLSVASAAVHFAGAGTVVPFVVTAAALAALAAVVGRSVDRLGDRLGPGATGVVQSALGNLPELFVGIFALRAGLVRVVEAALVGSVLANVLLVLGLAFMVGGLRHGPQRFAAEDARNMALLLVLAVAVVIIPSVSAHLGVAVSHHEQALSDVSSAVLLVLFVLAVPASLGRRQPPDAEADAASSWPPILVFGVLLAASVAAAFVSDWFVTALTPALGALHMSQAFAGLVVVAIAGNAVENVVGVQLAARNRPDYALSIILQSPVQIALALFPALVLISPALGGTHLTLVLPPLLVVVLALSAVVAALVVFDGESTWLEGACLIGLYTVIAAAFWWG
jgi:Ca2+:H+ antiporter